MQRKQKQELVEKIFAHGVLDGAFLFIMLLFSYPIRDHIDSHSFGPLPPVSELFFNILLPDFFSSIVLLVICFILIELLVGFYNINRIDRELAACFYLEKHVIVTKSIIFFIVVFYMFSWLFFIRTCGQMGEPDPPPLKEYIYLGVLVVIVSGLAAAVFRLWRKFMQDTPEEKSE